MIVRYRVDSMWQEKLRLPVKVSPALVARLKIMCNLDISGAKAPQDGRIVFKQYTKKSLDIDLRVSTAPLNYGEGVVMRILDKQKTTLPLTSLGFSEENIARYRECLRQPYGMILHCGPTGSGKSMTLYSALNEISFARHRDPDRRGPDRVHASGHQPDADAPPDRPYVRHRSEGLPLRQDPDIILVGEIPRHGDGGDTPSRRPSQATFSSRPSHTNDAPSTIARLTDMEIEPFMISSSILCVCAQRLMRRVCKQCKVQYEPKGREKELLEKAIGWSGPIFKHNPKGCPKCNSSGYRGRVGIHELMITNDELIEGINKKLDTAELKKIAQRQGMKTLHQDSLLKVKDGLTTLEEAISTVPPDL